MKIWLTRHGQTDLNRERRMQGRTDMPLNETGLAQAREARAKIEAEHPGLVFDAVYASPLQRAVATGAIIGDVDKSEIRIDERLIEADFGRYEKRKYHMLGLRMTAYWACPEVFPPAPTAETTDSMVKRARSFLADLEKEGAKQGYGNVLIVCHGGIMRVLSGCLENRPRGYRWRPKPHNCEIRIYPFP